MMCQWRWAESPLVDGDRVVVTPGGPRAGIVALEKATGKEIWRAAIPRIGSQGADGAGYSSIVISNGGGVKQYVQLMGRGLVGVRAADGLYLWGNNAVANDIANISTPVVKDNFVFASTGYGTGSVMLELAPAGGRARDGDAEVLPRQRRVPEPPRRLRPRRRPHLRRARPQRRRPDLHRARDRQVGLAARAQLRRGIGRGHLPPTGTSISATRTASCCSSRRRRRDTRKRDRFRFRTRTR